MKCRLGQLPVITTDRPRNRKNHSNMFQKLRERPQDIRKTDRPTCVRAWGRIAVNVLNHPTHRLPETPLTLPRYHAPPFPPPSPNRSWPLPAITNAVTFINIPSPLHILSGRNLSLPRPDSSRIQDLPSPRQSRYNCPHNNYPIYCDSATISCDYTKNWKS